MVSLFFFQDTVRKSEPKSLTTLTTMATRHLEQKIREAHFSTCDRLDEQPGLGGKKKETAVDGTPKVNVPEDKLAVSRRTHERQGSPSPSQKRKSSDTDDTTRKSSDTHGIQTGPAEQERPTNCLVSCVDKESETKRRDVSAGTLLIASAARKLQQGENVRVLSFRTWTIKATTKGSQGNNPFLSRIPHPQSWERPHARCGRRLHATSSARTHRTCSGQ